MSTDVEIDRALAAVTATLNDQELSGFDAGRVQQIVTASPGAEPSLTVDDGGGLHDPSGARVGVIWRTDGGEWITERQNDDAGRSATAVPAEPPSGRLRKRLTALHVRS